MLNLGLGLLCLLSGAAAITRGIRLFDSRLARLQTLERLSRLCAEETNRRRFHAVQQRQRLTA